MKFLFFLYEDFQQIYVIPYRYPSDIQQICVIPFRYPTDIQQILCWVWWKNTQIENKNPPSVLFTLGKTLDHGSYENQAQAQLLPCMGPYSNKKKAKAPWPRALYLTYYSYLNRYPPSMWVLLVLAKKKNWVTHFWCNSHLMLSKVLNENLRWHPRWHAINFKWVIA
jgi:hypothetical protein